MSLDRLARSLSNAQQRMHNAIKARFPEGMRVRMQIRSRQKKWTPATVMCCWSWNPCFVRVRLDTKKEKVVDVHYRNIVIDED